MPRNGLEPWQLLIVAIVIILLFGTKELPGPARALCRSMRILKSEAKAMKDAGTPRPTTASVEDATPASTEPADRLLRAVPSDDTTAQPIVKDAGHAR
ncbi:Sec-independent protein translocase subunit TatA [Streptomyces gibsoniae]|uniref:Sec-independent protein translocase protein TatA n=1 Tax=Streptomyces gibsoniae TaxID=3075529 RepID=A0ABU2U6A5_9ACTN|nr:Sec-independent protein translocase subunit TatA [Streptomyces sp. DSM 41699]MDT0468507.1 Sec-independent protein translocase subunit TatA [Streptomyces sp. DSM 41699]